MNACFPSTPSQKASRKTLIEARAVNLTRGGRLILHDVNLRVSEGEIVTLVGLNGSGKSTLVRVLLGLVAPDHGRVHRRAGLTIGYSPQRLQTDPTLPLTVARFLTLGGPASRAALASVLDEVGAGGLLDTQLADISGGELHRVQLARALLRSPELLVLDEPVAGVDIAGQSDIYRLIANIRDRRGCGVLLVSHDLHLVMADTDTVACLNHHICCTGRPESVTRHPEFVSLFGRQAAETLALYAHHHDHAHDMAGAVVPLEDEDRGPAEAAGP